MNKKMLGLIIIIIFSSTLFLGCTERKQDTSQILVQKSNNLSPVPILNCPEKAFFGEEIEFDASASYDSDGQINEYIWYISGERITGKKVFYAFPLPKNFDPQKTPYFYEVQLDVFDDKGAHSCYLDKISISPGEYSYFLNSNQLSTTKPAEQKSSLKGSLGIFESNPSKKLKYILSEEILIKNCKWNATIYLEKPILLYVKSISINLYDGNDQEFSSEKVKLNFFNVWKNKEFRFSGEINDLQNFKYAEIQISGFSIKDSISVLEGGEKASVINFDFS